MIGREQPKTARNTDLKGAIAIGLDECTTALEEALTGLTDEQAWAYPLPDRHNIVTIAMHCLENLNNHGLYLQTGESLLDPDARFDMWSHPPEELRPLQQDLPSVSAMIDTLRELREAIVRGLEAATEDDLRGPRTDSPWYRDWNRTSADAYLRTIMHTMAHLRQVWMLRGALGLTASDGWPLQHWA